MNTLPMITPTRSEFEARIEAVEARMDARFTATMARLDAFEARSEEREKRLQERDKRIELLVQTATEAAKSASNLKTHVWLAVSTLMFAVGGTVLAAYHATQSSHYDLAQTLISAFQQGQRASLKD
jgi:phosphotransferase system  glucose/maltose/N-acetylglucosamine-specific IIC component